jgi:DNA-binding response OmpR family regulator
MSKEHVLVIDDEESILDIVTYALNEAGFDVAAAHNIQEAEEQIERKTPDLMIVDVMLPDESGLEFCRRIRAESHVPIIMLSAKAEEVDKILGLELGADDYVTKPFSPRELVSRVKAQLRRAAGHDAQTSRIITVKDLVINTDSHEVTLKGSSLRLTDFEYQFLLFLARNPGKAFSRIAILDHIWGGDFVGDERTLDVHIHNLRKKIEENPEEPQYLLTVRNYGYRLSED